jgi:dTDP-glucose 4,6-dehydratase
VLDAVGKDDSLVTYKEAEPFTTRVKRMDFSKAIFDLKHDPQVSPEEGIKRTVDWMRSSYRLGELDRRLDAIPLSVR